MEIQDINVEEFIDEVKKHPCLWNLQSEDHRLLKKKLQAWDEVTKVFVQNYDELGDTDRVQISKKFQYKFRNLRDSYVRSIKRKDSSKPYIYERNLSFLEACYAEKHKIKVSSDSEDESDDGRSLRKKIKQENANKLSHDNFNLDYLASNSVDMEPLIQLSSVPKEFDDDRLFFESLLPLTRQFDMDQKLLFRSEVLNLITKVRRSTVTNPLDPKFPV